VTCADTVERTFGWLVKARRLVRDHEHNPRHREALVYIAMIGHSSRHLTANPAI
jgi:transposase